jgi:hypothetical protein
MAHTFCGTLLGLLAVAAAGCSGARRVPMPALDPQAAGQQALNDFDANKDGASAGAELDQCPGLKAGRATFDGDRDGRLTAQEIAARLAKYQEHKVALFAMTGHLTLDGRPLQGAMVTLVPEKLMGPAVKPARGVTDAGGYCSFQIEGEELRGVHPGVYRIEVSKKDASGKETLPARYNTKTIHRTEVGVDGIALTQGVELALTSR